jgi:hypothetical protein
MLAYLMFKTKALLDEFEDFVSAELLRLLQLDETAFAAAGMTLDYDHDVARFTLENCAPDLAVHAETRNAIWALGFESFILESARGKLEYTAAADRETEAEPERAAGAVAAS